MLFKQFEITPCPNIMNIKNISNFSPYRFEYGEEVVRYKNLNPYHEDFEYITELFEEDASYLYVDKVVKVYNPYLKKAFELTRHLHYNSVEPFELFHGTKEKYVDRICEYNLNWRYAGSERGHRLGKGINFTTDPSFASIFSDKGSYKVMILAEVLIKYACPGNKNLVVPTPGYDAAVSDKHSRKTYVKFDDQEFYPSYIIYCNSEQY